MTQNITRRDLFKQAAIALPVGFAFLATSACTQSQADQFIALNTAIIGSIQLALPIGELLLPPPYSLLLPTVATFLNAAGTAAASIANALASGGTALAQSQAVVSALEKLFLDPSVLKQLPADFTGPNGAVNVQALIQSVANTINAILAMAAHSEGGSVVPNPSNAVNTVIIAPVAAAAAHAKLAHTAAPTLSDKQKAKLEAIKDGADTIHKVLAGWPAPAALVRHDEGELVFNHNGARVVRVLGSNDPAYWAN